MYKITVFYEKEAPFVLRQFGLKTVEKSVQFLVNRKEVLSANIHDLIVNETGLKKYKHFTSEKESVLTKEPSVSLKD